MEEKNTRITIECPDEHDNIKRFIIEVSSELLVWDWIPYFKQMLEFMTYGKKNIDELFNKEMEE